MKPFTFFATAIKEYCVKNNLDFEKVKSFPKCGNSSFLLIQSLDERAGKRGLLDEIPAEILLTAKKDDKGNISIVAGKNASAYLHN